MLQRTTTVCCPTTSICFFYFPSLDSRFKYSSISSPTTINANIGTKKTDNQFKILWAPINLHCTSKDRDIQTLNVTGLFRRSNEQKHTRHLEWFGKVCNPTTWVIVLHSTAQDLMSYNSCLPGQLERHSSWCSDDAYGGSQMRLHWRQSRNLES